MDCYQCGHKLGSGRYCLRCGADVTVYRRIVYLSNSFYNAGLEKARVRDLTGAIEMLQRSLQLHKKNINARNLLGVVYYEMGEVVEALCQWVISKNFQPKDNLADDYLSRLQEDRNHLDTMNQAIRKYNQSLAHANAGNYDLAVIQLKRILQLHPNYIRAHQLLALLYIREEAYSKANKLLRQALKIDTGNTLCLKYARLIRGRLGRAEKSDRERKLSLQSNRALMTAEELLESDVIAPEDPEKSGRGRMLVGLLVGAAATFCMYQFVLLPTINRNSNVRNNQAISAYDAKLSEKELQITNLENQIADLHLEQQNMESSLADLTGDNGLSDQYDSLLKLLKLYMNREGNEEELASTFERIDENAVDSDIYREMYGIVKQYVTVDRIKGIFNEGVEMYDTHYYKNAIPVFERVLRLNPDYVDALYYLARCYEKRKDTENALQTWQQIADRFPESEYFEEAESKVEKYSRQLQEAEDNMDGEDGGD